MDSGTGNAQGKTNLNKKAAKAGAFFVVVQLLVRGVTFLVTPLYTRLVSTAQYGEIRVYESWLLILVPVLSLSLYRSVGRAKFDFREDYEKYVSSAQGLSYAVIAICYLAVTVFFHARIMDLTGMDGMMYAFMILYTFAHTSALYFQTRESQMLRYKHSMALTALMMFPATVLSVALLYWGNAHGLQGMLVDLRVIGYYLPQVIGGTVAAFMIWRQGDFCFDRKYWSYAVLYSAPLIPEALSIQIMNQSDKIMIQKMIGNEATGIFSLATTISFVIWIIEDAVWGAWMPWLYEKLDRGEVEDIQGPWDCVAYIFGFLSWALVVLAPELIHILGGTGYKDAIYLVAPMVTGVLFRFFSYSFTAVENYKKQTKYCAIGTMIAMVTNVILNAVCIRHIGYQAAAYTTAFSYFVLLAVQGYLEKKVCGVRCVSLKKMMALSIMLWLINEVTIFTYSAGDAVRWCIFIVASLMVIWRLGPGIKILRKQFAES